MATKRVKTAKRQNAEIIPKDKVVKIAPLCDMKPGQARNSARAIVKKHSKIIHALSKL